MRTLVLLPLLAGTGCVGTATSIVKAPFQVAGKAVDWTTTSQSEADRNYGRKMRKAEEREGRERRQWAKKCRGHENEPECQEYTGYRAATAGSARRLQPRHPGLEPGSRCLVAQRRRRAARRGQHERRINAVLHGSARAATRPLFDIADRVRAPEEAGAQGRNGLRATTHL